MPEEASAAGERILVGWDGSPGARKALGFARGLAAGRGLKLTLVHVINRVSPGVGRVSAQGWEEVEAYHRRQAQALLEEAAQELPPNLRGGTELPIGGGAEEIARLAERPEVEMVIVGATGKGAVSRILMGSVSSRLVRICPKPLLIVP